MLRIQTLRCVCQLLVLVAALVGSCAPQGYGALSRAREPEGAGGPFRRPVLIKFEGPIDWRLSKYFFNRLATARRANADLLVIEIESPGGLLSASMEIAEALRDVDWAYTVAFIPDRAISGAAIVALGCDQIIISPQGRIGDAGAIQFDPELFAFRFVPEKHLSEFALQVRALAEAKNRSVQLVEAMVDKDLLVFRRKSDVPAADRFRTVRWNSNFASPQDAGRQAGLDTEQWEFIEASEPGRFLTVDGGRAVELGLAGANASNREELSKSLNVAGDWVVHQRTLTDTIVYLMNTPVVTALLLIVGTIALYVEFSAPGVGAGGLIAGLCAVLFFWSRFLGGTSGWLEVILFLAGVTFLLMELFVIPGWGISGLLGLLFIAASVIMAGLDFVVPQTPRQWNEFLSSILVMVCAGTVVLIAAGWITRQLGSIPVFNRLILSPPAAATGASASKDDDKKPVPRPHPLVSVGDWGIAISLLRPAGRAKFAHRSIEVVSDGSFIEQGQQVRVIEIQGNRIVVAPIDEAESSGDSPS